MGVWCVCGVGVCGLCGVCVVCVCVRVWCVVYVGVCVCGVGVCVCVCACLFGCVCLYMWMSDDMQISFFTIKISGAVHHTRRYLLPGVPLLAKGSS